MIIYDTLILSVTLTISDTLTLWHLVTLWYFEKIHFTHVTLGDTLEEAASIKGCYTLDIFARDIAILR